MAAFVTALIPDLTLLHFRNTTEAGATSGSRDKGLHGKLKAGVCYSMLDTINSRHQRVVVGVRLQQVAGRDRKVDIKPFAIQGLPMSVQPTQLVTETLNERQARVLSLAELKDKLDEMEGVQFKQFNSITDYHSLMFDLGIIARRLRSASDRSKFYRLIEASLYGGISSAITRCYAIIYCRKTAACARHSRIWKRRCARTDSRWKRFVLPNPIAICLSI